MLEPDFVRKIDAFSGNLAMAVDRLKNEGLLDNPRFTNCSLIGRK